MKRNAVIAAIFLLASFAFSACAPTPPIDQMSEASNIAGNGASMEVPCLSSAGTPEFFHDIGKTLRELKNECPEGEFIVSSDGFPDSAAVCFGEPGAEYVSYFFGTQSGDAEKVMNEYEDRLKVVIFD